jgi:hypothetical protein
MNKKIRYCPDRKCDKSGLTGGKDSEFDPNFPVCWNDDSEGTTYCDTQIEIFGCPRGFLK